MTSTWGNIPASSRMRRSIHTWILILRHSHRWGCSTLWLLWIQRDRIHLGIILVIRSHGRADHLRRLIESRTYVAGYLYIFFSFWIKKSLCYLKIVRSNIMAIIGTVCMSKTNSALMCFCCEPFEKYVVLQFCLYGDNAIECNH